MEYLCHEGTQAQRTHTHRDVRVDFEPWSFWIDLFSLFLSGGSERGLHLDPSAIRSRYLLTHRFLNLMISLVSVKISKIQGCQNDIPFMGLQPELTQVYASTILLCIKNWNPTLSFQN